MTELRNLRGRINELESDLRERDEEVKILKEQQLKHSINGSQDESETIRVRHRLPKFYRASGPRHCSHVKLASLQAAWLITF